MEHVQNSTLDYGVKGVNVFPVVSSSFLFLYLLF